MCVNRKRTFSLLLTAREQNIPPDRKVRVRALEGSSSCVVFLEDRAELRIAYDRDVAFQVRRERRNRLKLLRMWKGDAYLIFFIFFRALIFEAWR